MGRSKNIIKPFPSKTTTSLVTARNYMDEQSFPNGYVTLERMVLYQKRNKLLPTILVSFGAGVRIDN